MSTQTIASPTTAEIQEQKPQQTPTASKVKRVAHYYNGSQWNMFKFTLAVAVCKEGEVNEIAAQLGLSHSSISRYKSSGKLIRTLYAALREVQYSELPSETCASVYEVFRKLSTRSMQSIWAQYCKYTEAKNILTSRRPIDKRELLTLTCHFADQEAQREEIVAYFRKEYEKIPSLNKHVRSDPIQGDVPSDIAGGMATALVLFTEAYEDNLSIAGIRKAYQKAQFALRMYREVIVDQNAETTSETK